jgi:hypothetical protein
MCPAGGCPCGSRGIRVGLTTEGKFQPDELLRSPIMELWSLQTRPDIDDLLRLGNLGLISIFYAQKTQIQGMCVLAGVGGQEARDDSVRR